MALGVDDAMGMLPVTEQERAEPPAKKVKNVHLRHWELPPGQLLNPMGMSGAGKISLEQLWNLLSKGSDHSKYFCNLCSDDPVRRRVGVSQLSGVFEVVCIHLAKDRVLDAIVKPDVMKQAREEAEELLPHFRKLNQGKSQRNGVTRLRSAAYYDHDVSRPAKEDLDAAATAIHAWLSKPQSKLRAMIATLSSGGLLFVGQCHEKAARAFVHHGGGNVDAMKAAANAVEEGGGWPLVRMTQPNWQRSRRARRRPGSELLAWG